MLDLKQGNTKAVSGVKWLLVVLAASLVGLWLYFFPSYSWHQKMTVEVKVDGQIYSGSSVVDMRVSGNPDFGIVPGVRSYGLRGEAVVVELPGDRYLFALLTFNVFDTGRVFHDLVGGVVSEPEKGWASRIRDVEEVRDIAPQDYPLLVTFTDINDPKTVQKVDPENLGATLGPGVSLKRITLEITDEPVTEGKIEQVLGWWCDFRKKRARLNGSTSIGISDNELSNNLGTGSFRIGDCS